MKTVENEIIKLCSLAREIFLKEPALLQLEAPLKICGDIHGQFSDLLSIFEIDGEHHPKANYLFLGNYVDYGEQSLETICLLFAFKIKYPKSIHLLRGSHECASMTRLHGFYSECRLKFNADLWKHFIECFDCLPIAAIVDKKIFCCHGGLSPELNTMDQIKGIKRPTDIPDIGLLCDLVWSDPVKDITGWAKGKNDRDVSFTFGGEIVRKFNDRHKLDLIVRGHQAVTDGYEFFAKRQLITIFSAPGFRTQDNAGAIMEIDKEHNISFQIKSPKDKNFKRVPAAVTALAALHHS